MAYIDFQLRHEVVKLKRAIVKVISQNYPHNASARIINIMTLSSSELLLYHHRHVCPQVLILLFLNGSVWLAGSFLFIHLEGSTEAAHKCGWFITIVIIVTVTITIAIMASSSLSPIQG